MKRIPSLCSVLALAPVIALAASCSSQPKQVSGPGGPQPPLLDRELFFGDPVITAAQLSPDGQYIAFIKPYQGVRNIWVKRVDEGFARPLHEDVGQAKPVTADKRPVPGYFWSRDGSRILYVQDKGGNENFHVYAVDPSAAPEAATGVPSARDLTDVEGVRARIYSVPRNDPKHILVGLNDRDPAYHDVYRVHIDTGARELLLENKEKVGFFVYDQNGKVRLAIRQISGGSSEILRVDGEDLVPIYTTTYEEQAFPVQFHPDGNRVYMQTNKGADVDRSQLVLMNVQTGATEVLESDPEGQVDFGAAVFHNETDELLATVYIGDRVRIYPKNEKIKADMEFLEGKFPQGELGFESSTRNMELLLVSVSSDVDPGSTYLYNRQTKAVDLVYRSRPNLPSEHLAPMKPVRYSARDGLEIPGYLTVPRGVEAKNLPTVLFVHGGPWARDVWGYDGYAQFLANRGYAVMQPNFRSSSGYGKKFLNAGNRQWGIGAMQHDISDAVQWLVEQGITDPKKVCIFGGSYGGYATLAGVAFTPDLYTCGIPYVAPSNLITLIESFPAYWRPFLEGTWFTRVGDPAKPADRQDLILRSPLNAVDKIKVPLLVVHGANDPRVKQAESDQIIVALREKGHQVEYIVAPDEGHGFRAPENRTALAVAIENFLAKHLGGRAQSEVPAEVAGKLAAITVDVATVTLPSSAEEALAAAAMTAPLPATDGTRLQAIKLEYKGQLEAGPRKFDITSSRVVVAGKAGSPSWTITDATVLPMGQIAHTVHADKKTLRPLSATMSGMMSADVSYSDTAITGTMNAMGQKTDVNTALEAPVWDSGPGFGAALATLPLAEGYKTTFRWFDFASQKVEAFQLLVKGTETTTVAAGTYETYLVVLEPLGDVTKSGIMRVMKAAPHHVIKSKIDIKAPTGSMVLTNELTAITR